MNPTGIPSEDSKNYINENNYRWVINEDYSRKLIHPEPKGTKIFAENYQDIISKYYDHSKFIRRTVEDQKKFFRNSKIFQNILNKIIYYHSFLLLYGFNIELSKLLLFIYQTYQFIKQLDKFHIIDNFFSFYYI